MPMPAGFAPASEGELVELEVDSLAVGGDGVAREPSGRIVFLPRTAPGDRVRVRIEQRRASWARGRPAVLLRAGRDRRPSPCPYYHSCGGCQLQHLTLAAQREAKRRAVRDALERIGGVRVAVPLPEVAGPAFGYRNRVTFTLRRGEEGIRAGYHRFDRPADLLDVEDCPLAEAPVREAWAELRGVWGAKGGALPAGAELRLTLRASEEGRVSLSIRGGDPRRPGLPGRVAVIAGGLVGYHWTPTDGRRRLLAGEETLRESWAGLALDLGPEAFLQVNRKVAEAMDRYVDAIAARGVNGSATGDVSGPGEAVGGKRILDLYAGVGTRAIRWAAAGARAVAVETGEDAVASGRKAAERYGVPVEFRRERVEDCLDRLLPADLIVVNPPRAGLSEEVSARLVKGGVGILVYVSCDPATLARDLRRLSPAWSVVSVRPFDAFPQTAHVETIVRLEPYERRAA